jgi:hypothetical protein
MKFKLDENFGPTTPALFGERGHDCQTVHQENLTGSDDASVLAAAVAEARILIRIMYSVPRCSVVKFLIVFSV